MGGIGGNGENEKGMDKMTRERMRDKVKLEIE